MPSSSLSLLDEATHPFTGPYFHCLAQWAKLPWLTQLLALPSPSKMDRELVTHMLSSRRVSPVVTSANNYSSSAPHLATYCCGRDVVWPAEWFDLTIQGHYVQLADSISDALHDPQCPWHQQAPRVLGGCNALVHAVCSPVVLDGEHYLPRAMSSNEFTAGSVLRLLGLEVARDVASSWAIQADEGIVWLPVAETPVWVQHIIGIEHDAAVDCVYCGKVSAPVSGMHCISIAGYHSHACKWKTRFLDVVVPSGRRRGDCADVASRIEGTTMKLMDGRNTMDLLLAVYNRTQLLERQCPTARWFGGSEWGYPTIARSDLLTKTQTSASAPPPAIVNSSIPTFGASTVVAHVMSHRTQQRATRERPTAALHRYQRFREVLKRPREDDEAHTVAVDDELLHGDDGRRSVATSPAEQPLCSDVVAWSVLRQALVAPESSPSPDVQQRIKTFLGSVQQAVVSSQISRTVQQAPAPQHKPAVQINNASPFGAQSAVRRPQMPGPGPQIAPAHVAAPLFAAAPTVRTAAFAPGAVLDAPLLPQPAPAIRNATPWAPSTSLPALFSNPHQPPPANVPPTHLPNPFTAKVVAPTVTVAKAPQPPAPPAKQPPVQQGTKQPIAQQTKQPVPHQPPKAVPPAPIAQKPSAPQSKNVQRPPQPQPSQQRGRGRGGRR